MKKMLAMLVIALFAASFVYAADAEKSGATKASSAVAGQKAQMPRGAPGHPYAKPNFAMVFGTISKIDTTDPANPKIEMTSSMDNKPYTIYVTPWTSITQSTDLTDLKAGDTARVMVRKADGKDVAINVMFGKMRTPPMPKPVAKEQTPVPAAVKQ
jgi:hypothetical protein